MFDGCVARGGDAGEVHHLIDFGNELEVSGGGCDHAVAIGEVGREDGIQFMSKRHVS